MRLSIRKSFMFHMHILVSAQFTKKASIYHQEGIGKEKNISTDGILHK